MRVLACGSRTWNRIKPVVTALQKLPAGSTVIHGAYKGADTIIDVVASELGLNVERYPADFAKFGKSAGPKRNRQMLDAGPDLVIAFIDENFSSPGTRNMIALAEAYGVKVVIVSMPCDRESAEKD